ncbi:hypothetical protein BDW62DRAFT_198864 [Aspergillus aurantiobrunneus]
MNPPMPHPHHATVYPGERPHGFQYNNPSGVMNHDHLANQMGQLHIQQDRLHQSNEARSRNFIDGSDIDEYAERWYVGYTFFKAQPIPGYSESWKKVNKTRMNLPQHDLSDIVRKRAKRISVADQYQSLTMVKRPHVDQLIEDLRQSHPQFQWGCVYVKEETKDVNFRRDYKTTSMDIILMGKSIKRPSSRTPIQLRDQRPVQVQRPFPENQHGPPFGSGPYADPRTVPGYPPGPIPSQMPNMQPGPARPHQPGPSPIRPPSQDVMGEPPRPEQSNWPDEIPRSQPPHPRPVVHNNYVNQPPVPETRPDVQDHGVRRIAVDQNPKSHKNDMTHQSTSKNYQAKARGKRDKSPKQRLGSEPDLVYDSTSSGDEIMTPDHDGEDSEEEFSGRDTKSIKTPLPWRGSLHRSHSSSQPRHSYRTHYRKQPQRLGDHGYRKHREDGIIDIIPADARHSARRASRTHGGSRQWWPQPRIVHQQPSSDDLEVTMNQIRGRAQNDIRSRMLYHWETDLEEREQMIEYQKQMLKDSIRNDRLDDVGFMNRPRSLREPMPAYPRGYLQRALH